MWQPAGEFTGVGVRGRRARCAGAFAPAAQGQWHSCPIVMRNSQHRAAPCHGVQTACLLILLMGRWGSPGDSLTFSATLHTLSHAWWPPISSVPEGPWLQARTTLSFPITAQSLLLSPFTGKHRTTSVNPQTHVSSPTAPSRGFPWQLVPSVPSLAPGVWALCLAVCPPEQG